MAGIYMHIPFCKRKCYYCDFYSCTLLAKKEAVLAAMEDELMRRVDFLEGAAVRTIYIGGGTPSLCSPLELGRLIRRVEELYDTSRLEEVTVEANPDDLSLEYLKALRQEGVDRLSIGIQSFSDRDLQWMHRRHNAQGALCAVEQAREAGFENLTIDLIYGTGRMTLAEWEQNVKQAIRLDVPHISAYHLTLEPGTVFGERQRRGTLQEVDPQQSQQEYRLLHDLLTAAGYEHYEISNFARPGFHARHNSRYWDGTPYLGVGPSAHSYNGKCRQWNIADVRSYLELEPYGTHIEMEKLSDQTLYNEFIMTGLRTAKGVDVRALEERFGARKLYYFTRLAEKFLQQGVLIKKEFVYYIPFEHFLISDTIIADFFDV